MAHDLRVLLSLLRSCACDAAGVVYINVFTHVRSKWGGALWLGGGLCRWNGSMMRISSCGEEGVLAEDVGVEFVDGSYPIPEVEYFCFAAGLEGLVVDVFGGTKPEEVSWTITFPNGDVSSGSGGGSTLIGNCSTGSPTVMPISKFLHRCMMLAYAV